MTLSKQKKTYEEFIHYHLLYILEYLDSKEIFYPPYNLLIFAYEYSQEEIT